MAQHYNPRIVTDGLVMCLDPSQNKSYPTDLPVNDQLNLWLDAADDTTFSYSSGTTVSQWRDKSGQNNHAVVVSGSPLRSVAINSRKSVSFTSTTSFRCLTGQFSSTATHFVVCRATTSSATYQRVYNGGTDSRIFIGGLANNIATFWGNSSGWIDVSVNSPAITILNTLRIISTINNGSTGTPYYDGTAMSTKTTTNSGSYIGYELNSYSGGITGQALIGEVCEIIVFNKTLSDNERKLVHTYLGQKWGISNADRSIIDLSGNDDNGLLGNGTVANMPVYSYYNKGTFKFDGSADYINCGNANALNFGSGDFSVEMWFTRDSNATTNLRLLSKGADSDVSGSAGFAFFGSDSGINFAINPSGARTIISAASYSVGEWVHVVAVVQRGSTMRTYKNAVLTSSATAPAGSVSSASNNLNIGRSSESSSLYWAGNIAMVRIYNKALSVAEITQNYEAQKSKFANTIVQQGLVLNLDAGNPYSYAGSGTTWYDVSGNSNNSTLTFGPTYSTTNGGIINFDGVDDYSVSTVASITASSTIGLWIKCASYDNKIPISIAGAVYGSGPNIFFYNSTINWNIGDGGGNPFTNSYYPNSNWHYIVITNDSATNAKLYIDGVLIGTAAYRNTASTNSNNFWIGRFSGNNDYTINASIGQVQLYNRVLSAAEALQNYNATKGRYGL